MVPALELTDEEVLEHLQKMLKGVSVVSLAVLEYSAKNPPPAMSCSFLCGYFCVSFVVSTFA